MESYFRSYQLNTQIKGDVVPRFYSFNLLSANLLYSQIMKFEYADYICSRRLRPALPQKKECPGYNTKLHLVVRFQLWRSGECRVCIHCHYSQIHSEPDW